MVARLLIAALTAGWALTGCSETLVGGQLFFCSATAPCGEGQICMACPAGTRWAERALCGPEGSDVVALCGGPLGSQADAEPDAEADSEAEASSDIADTADAGGVDEVVGRSPDAELSLDGGSADADAGGDEDSAATPLEAPSISPTRTAGVAPLGVVFDAGDSWGPEVSVRWSFGAYGPVAARVFEAPGSYPIEVTVTGPSGAALSDSVTIEVSDPEEVFAGETVCVRALGSPDEPCPGGGVTTSAQFFDVALTQSGSARRILFRRGDTFESFTGATVPTGPGQLGAYGADAAAPRVVGQSFASLTLAADWRVSDLHFERDSGVESPLMAGDHILLLRVTSTGYEHFAEVGPGSVVALSDTGSLLFDVGSAVLGGRVVRADLVTPAALVGAHVTWTLVIGGGGRSTAVGNLLESTLYLPGRAFAANNIALLHGSDPGIEVLGDGALVAHTTCYAPSGLDESPPRCIRTDGSASNATVLNTLLVAPTNAQLLEDDGAGTSVCGACNVHASPEEGVFGASPSAPEDFQPKPLSAPVDAGEPLPAVPLDLGGRCRPNGAAWDVGAWESGASPCE